MGKESGSIDHGQSRRQLVHYSDVSKGGSRRVQVGPLREA